MKRRVIQIGNSTQLVSLPRKWAKQFDIKKGDELDVLESGNKLIVSTYKEEDYSKVEVDVSNLDRSSLMIMIRSLYKKGYDEIKIRFNKQLTTHYRKDKSIKVIQAIHVEASRLAGLEVVQQKENFCLLKVFSKIDERELDGLIRRIFILVNDAAKDVVYAAKTCDTVLLNTIEEKHDTVTKFLSYALRIINKKRIEDKNTHFLYITLSTIDKVIDVLKNCGRIIEKFSNPMKKETIVFLDQTVESFTLFYELYYKYKDENIMKLSLIKENFLKNLSSISKKVPLEEALFLSHMHEVLELFKALVEARMAMEY